jgi:hypothetical protein
VRAAFSPYLESQCILSIPGIVDHQQHASLPDGGP